MGKFTTSFERYFDVLCHSCTLLFELALFTFSARFINNAEKGFKLSNVKSYSTLLFPLSPCHESAESGCGSKASSFIIFAYFFFNFSFFVIKAVELSTTSTTTKKKKKRNELWGEMPKGKLLLRRKLYLVLSSA